MKLTIDFLRNETSMRESLLARVTEAHLKEYYFWALSAVRECLYLEPTRQQIEEYIENGFFTYKDGYCDKDWICPETSEQERKYLFKMAQAKQLISDFECGRASMRGEELTICPDTVQYLKALGLYQRTFMAV